jgi:hypothetical protein
VRSPYSNYCTPIINACQLIFPWYIITRMERQALSPVLAAIKDTLDRLVKAVTEYHQSKATYREQKAETESKAIVRLPIEIPAYYEAENRERGPARRRERIRLVLEFGGVGVAIILAILTYCTLQTFDAQLSVMQQQTTDAAKDAISTRRHAREELRIAQWQASAAQRSANAAARSADASAKTFEAGYRPYVGVDTVDGPIWNFPRKFFSVKISIKDFGVIPASAVSVKIESVLNFGVPRPWRADFPSTVFPNQPSEYELVFSDPVLFQEVLADTNKLLLKITTAYEGNGKKYSICQQLGYMGALTQNRFSNEGDCKPRK